MPRRLDAPDLADDLIRLEPLSRALATAMQWLVEPDPDIAAFTYIPSSPGDGFLDYWLGRYEDGWRNGERAGFATWIDGAAVGFAAFVRLDVGQQEGEIGYVLSRAARGRGVATRAVGLLTEWGFGELALERIELRIDDRNAASKRVAERAGYSEEGVLRNVAFKEGIRTDVSIWSRLARP
ncbi:MAG TPA: GNAT family protein [Gaiellaceae bacterium]|nr:GNAT family protein [Gaiellaceae bacterium]